MHTVILLITHALAVSKPTMATIQVKDICLRRMKTKKKKRRLMMEKITEGVESAAQDDDDDEKRIEHYGTTSHNILIVGEQDFSFSASLAAAIGSASNIISTSLETPDFLAENYENALSNVVTLRKMGCKVMHGVNATRIANHSSLHGFAFNRIVFHFPYAAGLPKKSRTSRLRRHRGIVRKFIENGKGMMGEKGEIHITHKINGFHREWDITNLVYQQGLELVQVVDFEVDDNVNCYPIKTYMFRFFI